MSSGTASVHRVPRVCAVPLLGACVAYAAHRKSMRRLQDPVMQRAQFRTTTWTLALLAWPWMWRRLVLRECHASALVGLAWPYAVMLIDARAGDDLRSRSDAESVLIEPQHILSMCFACSGIVAAASDRRHMSLFMWPIVALLITSTAEPRGSARHSYNAIRTVVSALCGGLLLTGLLFRGTEQSLSA